jgi:hypothetical protein
MNTAALPEKSGLHIMRSLYDVECFDQSKVSDSRAALFRRCNLFEPGLLHIFLKN